MENSNLLLGQTIAISSSSSSSSPSLNSSSSRTPLTSSNILTSHENFNWQLSPNNFNLNQFPFAGVPQINQQFPFFNENKNVKFFFPYYMINII